MRLLALRVLGVSVLLGLYLIHPVAGVSALASGCAYLVWQRARRVTA